MDGQTDRQTPRQTNKQTKTERDRIEHRKKERKDKKIKKRKKDRGTGIQCTYIIALETYLRLISTIQFPEVPMNPESATLLLWHGEGLPQPVPHRFFHTEVAVPQIPQDHPRVLVEEHCAYQ